MYTRVFKLFTDPYLNDNGRESYFGFAIALQRGPDNTAWLMVGAPRANSSNYKNEKITEPGVLYKCNLQTLHCQELFIDQTGNTVSNYPSSWTIYQDLKNGGWLGGTLDAQPTFDSGRQATGVCAPRWINQHFIPDYFMNGACYWLNNSLTEDAHKKLPLLSLNNAVFKIGVKSLYFYAHGEAGLSLHFPDNPAEMIIGAPGVFNWQGSVIRMSDNTNSVPGEISRRRRRQSQIKESDMFDSSFVPNPYFTSVIEDFDLLGYAVTSGRFMSKDELLYVGGAPRGALSHGKVLIFSYPDYEYQSLNVKAEWQGTQLGEYFGAAVTAADINGDGLSDLVVGSPMYALQDIPDVGRIQVFLSSKGQVPQKSDTSYFGSKTSFARFGTTLASVGDLNFDRFDDVVVGAPWEGAGAVYVYLGSSSGLRPKFSQRITPADFPQSLSGFGMGFSRGIDIDDNGYPDVKGNVTLDYGSSTPRAVFATSQNFSIEFNETVVMRQKKCIPYLVTIMENKLDPRQPVLMKMIYELVETPWEEIIKQPMLDPDMETSITSRVSIVTGCEMDGNETCLIDMILETSFSNYRDDKRLIIGKDNKLKMEVVVENAGEPVFLPNLTVIVNPPLTLFLPSSHNCDFPNGGNRTRLICNLANPITNSGKDTVKIDVDASQLTDTSNKVSVDVIVSGEGVEQNNQDNNFQQALQLEAQAKLKLHGYSKDEQVLYPRLEEDKINASSSPIFFHQLTLLKEGPTPLGKVVVVVDIPVNFTKNDETFVKIYAPKTDFLGQPVVCHPIGASFAVERRNEDDMMKTTNNVLPKPPSNRGEIVTLKKASTQKTPVFNCSNSLIKCAKINCHINSWPVGISSAEIVFKLEIDLAILAGYITARDGAVLQSTATASITSLNPDIVFTGEKVTSVMVKTQIQPDSLPGRGVPWWIILLAVLAGLLLLGLLAYGLYRAGFFTRKEQEKMKAQQAHVQPAGNVNSGIVGD
ncbi:Integrin alpha-PS3-like [Homarus americanus]|uniref:Integrin alpha-PS3-like n=1 Tax=Homarus americanus TaxID=6706 RepID=A0A8J5K061_HOMAM|nr:Integrin alpha-PS3-like [Homarus americanus]